MLYKLSQIGRRSRQLKHVSVTRVCSDPPWRHPSSESIKILFLIWLDVLLFFCSGIAIYHKVDTYEENKQRDLFLKKRNTRARASSIKQVRFVSPHSLDHKSKWGHVRRCKSREYSEYSCYMSLMTSTFTQRVLMRK